MFLMLLVFQFFEIQASPLSNLIHKGIDEVSCKDLINKTYVAIAKARKEAISHKKNDLNGKLARLYILQANAVSLYNKNNYSEAACSSTLARKYASEIITSLNPEKDADSFYFLTDEEKKKAEHCSNDEDILKKAKNAQPTLSEIDSQYINSNMSLGTIKFEIN